MPKKGTKHVKTTSGTTKRTHVVADSVGLETVVEHSSSVNIGIANVKRWILLKKRMGFTSDDDLAVHLLDLAESIERNNENKNDDDNGDNNTKIIEKETSRRSPRKQALKHGSGEEKKSTRINTIDQHDERHKLKNKHHRSKTKHHKDKRKKKRHSKNIELNNITINPIESLDINSSNVDNYENSHTTTDDLVKSITEEVNNPRGSRDESVIQKTEKLDTLVLANKLDSKENISENSQANADCIDSDTTNVNQNFTKNLSSQCSVVKHVISNTVIEIIQKDFNDKNSSESPLEQENSNNINFDTEIISTADKNLSSTTLNNEGDDKKIRKKRKHSKNELDQSEDNEKIDDLTLKHRKRKHKHAVDKNKKNHDIRKAPQDGMIPAEICESQQTVTSEAIKPTSNDSQVDIDNDGGTLEPQRLAIKIKLCQDCNNRHIQGACPLVSPAHEITDIITHENWLNNHKNNPEVMKALSTEDPMSEGYGKIVDDGFESDEDSPEQFRSKTKVQSEEKRLQIDKERPLYARDSLPHCLILKMTNNDHGLGIFAKTNLSIYTKLGPLVGTLVKEMDIPDDYPMRHIWEIDNDGKTSYISTTNPLQSNWVRYMRPAEIKEDRNVAVINKQGELYFVTTQNIVSGSELTYWADSQSFAWTRKNKTDKTNCGGCNLTFAHSIYYRLHCCIFHDTNYSLTIRKYHCKVCGAAVLGKDNIMKHAAELHAGRGAYQCQYCRKFFLRLNYLEMHRTYGCAQNPQRSRPLCDFCGRKFCQPQKLKVHIKRMHSDMSEVLREFQCKLCLKLLGSRAALQRHMKEVHHKDVVAAATCDRCGKMFQNKSNLKIHMLTHSGVKPFKCKESTCKAAFTTKQCLQFHYKKVHGLSEEMMPKIERSVAYTFDAYSGGMLDDMTSSKSPRSSRHSSQDQANSLPSMDDCSSDGSMKNDPILDSNNPSHIDSLDISPERSINRESPRESRQELSQFNVNLEPTILNIRQDLDPVPTKLQSKGSKKWMGEFNPPAKIITDQSPHTLAPADVYEFDDSIKKDEGRSVSSSPPPLPPLSAPSSSLIDDNKLTLSVYRRTESANASLLVEAALDAAERDIGAVSSPMLDDNDRDGHLYTISNHLQSPLPTARTPDHHLESYIQQEDLMSPVPTPDNRNSSPTTHLHTDYHLHRSIDYVNTTRTHNIEQYLHHDDLQRTSPPNNYINMSHGELGVLTGTNSRYSDIHHHHQQQQQQQQQQLHNHHHSGENLSSDEGDSVAQNLSISVKKKSLQLDLSTSYKYDSLDLEFSGGSGGGARERGNFEPLVLNNSELQGLDMSARGFHSFGTQLPNRYHHHHPLYDITERQSVDLSRTGAYSISPPPPYPTHNDVLRVVSLDLTPGGRHSVDLSLTRSHHLHGSSTRIITSPRPSNSGTPHIVPEIIEGRMLSSPPPPPLPGYNSAYPVSPASYHPPRPGYHHYSGYY